MQEGRKVGRQEARKILMGLRFGSRGFGFMSLQSGERALSTACVWAGVSHHRARVGNPLDPVKERKERQKDPELCGVHSVSDTLRKFEPYSGTPGEFRRYPM